MQRRFYPSPTMDGRPWMRNSGLLGGVCLVQRAPAEGATICSPWASPSHTTHGGPGSDARYRAARVDRPPSLASGGTSSTACQPLYRSAIPCPPCANTKSVRAIFIPSTPAPQKTRRVLSLSQASQRCFLSHLILLLPPPQCIFWHNS